MTKRKDGHGNYLPTTTGKVSDKERKEATERILAESKPYVIGPFCNCLQHPFPHPAHTDELPIFEYHRSLGKNK